MFQNHALRKRMASYRNNYTLLKPRVRRHKWSTESCHGHSPPVVTIYSHFLDTVNGVISHGTIKHMTLLIGYFMDENDKENISASVKKEFQILSISFCDKNFVVLL